MKLHLNNWKLLEITDSENQLQFPSEKKYNKAITTTHKYFTAQ